MNKRDVGRLIYREGLAEIRKECFEQVYGLQTEWNKYVMEHCVKCVIQEHLLEPLGHTDKLCNQLEMLLDVDPCVIKCAVLRNDYFMTEEGEMKMVEYNTIAVSLLAVASEAYKQLGGEVNDPLKGLVEILTTAAKFHKDHYNLDRKLNILMLVTDKDEQEGNIDQELICGALQNCDVTVNRTSLKNAKVELKEGHLYYENVLVNVVYLRGGYMEMTEVEFKNRHWIEKSLACKVNNANVQLFGMKLMQSALLSNSEAPSTYKSLQVRMMPADQFEDDSSNDWIFKSNREGGNSCIFDSTHFNEIEDKRGWIIMERIKAQVQNGYTHEVGIYGGVITLQRQVLENNVLGYLVRTKRKEVNESGVNAGYAKVNSLCFITH